ncbi:16S rRNA (cytosine(1402)-N(4))-methyltransferase RsmH [Candidatus Saccharibacteria bacterium]|nr:16S rRNA (cytosine(1402)-N(4))-methyltransferase RsmH [Candidatus Saccharibacteria bacterium]MBP9985793.1 16S rRNA (cytosine(1402)-N(4))-methyltransferase RsmH [Candidatus Saccharibacteria bacterium]
MSSIQLDTKEHPPHLHVPVLLEQSLSILQPKKGESYLDLTAGYGGHAKEFLKITKNYKDSVLVDRDEFAILNLKALQAKGAELMHTDFISATEKLIEEEKKFDIVFVDLGVSSPQLDKEERGFSFNKDGPLDMRMDRRQDISAADIVNRATPKELETIIAKYGEEKPAFTARIVEAIRTNRPIRTTKELSDLILSQHRGGWQKTHPATRTFQALRIATNEEIKQVENLLPKLSKLLNNGGRVGIISFHSLEDRLVKQYFKDQDEAGLEASLKLLTKKPIDGATYDVHNPRSRSAKLRAAVKK